VGKLRELYLGGLRVFFRNTFDVWQRLGFSVIPLHYYQPIPETRTLSEELWEKRSELPGLVMNEEEQIEFLSVVQKKYKDEYDAFPRDKTEKKHEFYMNNDAFGSVDAEVLYCVIRHFKPRRIIEIGSGYSTYLSAKAIRKNNEEDRAYDCALTAIEPYPNKTLVKGFPGLTELVPMKVQSVPVSFFDKLVENDILFIDSSHVLKLGGDVLYEYLDILPRLKKGVLVHIHDIFIPAEYPKDWVFKNRWFWTEQYLLQAFMAFNDSFKVLWAGSYMNHNHQDRLSLAFASFRKNGASPGSFWIRKTR